MGSNGFEPLKAKRQQIYSLSPLAARATPHETSNQDLASGNKKTKKTQTNFSFNATPYSLHSKKPAGGGI